MSDKLKQWRSIYRTDSTLHLCFTMPSRSQTRNVANNRAVFPYTHVVLNWNARFMNLKKYILAQYCYCQMISSISSFACTVIPKQKCAFPPIYKPFPSWYNSSSISFSGDCGNHGRSIAYDWLPPANMVAARSYLLDPLRSEWITVFILQYDHGGSLPQTPPWSLHNTRFWHYTPKWNYIWGSVVTNRKYFMSYEAASVSSQPK